MNSVKLERMNTMMKRFIGIKPINRLEIPMSRGRGRNSSLKQLRVVHEFNSLLDYVVKEGVNPYEIAGEIDTTNQEVIFEKNRRKSFHHSFKQLLKESVKKHGLQNKIDVIEHNKGEKFFIVGRAV